jgi:hypothetical protein
MAGGQRQVAEAKKANLPKQVPERKEHRGRPLTYTTEVRRLLSELIRKHGIRGARRVAPITVCQNTMGKIAAEFGIVLKKGRRKAA